MAAIAEWNKQKTALIGAIIQAHTRQEAQNLHPQYLTLLQIFENAVRSQGSSDGDLNKGVISLSILDSLSLILGLGGIVLGNTDQGEEMPWLKSAGITLVAFSQVFSKWNDKKAYHARIEAEHRIDWASITGQDAFLNLVNTLLRQEGNREANTWEKDKAHFLEAIQKPSEGHIVSFSLTNEPDSDDELLT